MKCRNPFIGKGLRPYPCGQCLPCRVNRRRMWAHRIMLEATQHSSSVFVTLTYDDEHLPEDGSLRPRDLQLWLKRLRKFMAPTKIRFYAVGEYGDETGRPHYHAVLFGFPSCSSFGTVYNRSGCCDSCRVVRDTWGKGRIHVGVLEKDSAGYVCGYVVKKMTKADDVRLNGRHPEFARQSRMPGIGRDAMFEVADRLMKYELNVNDIFTLRHGPKQMPLGRYLRMKLAEMSDQEIVEGPVDEEVLAVLEAASRLPRSFPKRFWIKETLIENGVQVSRNIEARVKRQNRRVL